MSQLDVRPARPDERAAALRMAFQHLNEREQLHKVRTAQDMVNRGELDADSIWVAVDGTGIAGCIMAIATPGAASIVWPPRCRRSLANRIEIDDALTQNILTWLRSGGVRIAQTLLLPEEAAAGEPLLRNGFQNVTRLLYLRHFLDLSAEELAKPERLTHVTVDRIAPAELEQVVTQTYEGSQDCPELNHTRGAAEFLAGHRAAADYDPQRWWVAYLHKQPVGVILMNQSEPETWDMAYLGVVPDARKRGVGRELVRKALFEAKAAGMLMVTLALDERNDAARQLYHRSGFEPFDERIVLLKTL